LNKHIISSALIAIHIYFAVSEII